MKPYKMRVEISMVVEIPVEANSEEEARQKAEEEAEYLVSEINSEFEYNDENDYASGVDLKNYSVKVLE